MERKNYVLVHGAYHGAWCWKDVASGLTALGHKVATPTWTGLGERSHLLRFGPTLETFIDDVAQVIHFEDLRDVILVGHSFAGSVVSAIADRMPERLRHLVYLDALVLRSGESSASRSPERIAAYRALALASDDPLGIPPADPVHFGITDPRQVAWVKPRLTPHPLQTYYDKLNLQHPLGNGVPVTYIACSKPYFASTALSREIAQAMPDWAYLSIPTGHDAMVLMPGELTEMLAALG
jgi:pimeloyl-ACP methyl ester carboxylesterase